MGIKRLNLNLDEELVRQLDDYASKMHISRTSALSILLWQFFKNQKSIQTIYE